MLKPTLSVVIITKNEEDMIEGCLKSVSWADEIIVVDCGSSDKTVSISKKYTERVIYHPWKGFASQKNFGISCARGKWILIIDADERISLPLKQEIIKVLEAKTPRADVFSFLHKNFFLGREMRYGDWDQDWTVRLFRKGKAKYSGQEIHEYLEHKGEIRQLTGPLFHFSHRDIASNLLKTRHYALVQSEIEVKRGFSPITRWTLFKSIIEHFWLRFITLKGYKDGMEGFIEATYQAFSQIFVIQSMVWERQRKKSSRDIYRDLEKQLMGHKVR